MVGSSACCVYRVGCAGSEAKAGCWPRQVGALLLLAVIRWIRAQLQVGVGWPEGRVGRAGRQGVKSGPCYKVTLPCHRQTALSCLTACTSARVQAHSVPLNPVTLHPLGGTCFGKAVLRSCGPHGLGQPTYRAHTPHTPTHTTLHLQAVVAKMARYVFWYLSSLVCLLAELVFWAAGSWWSVLTVPATDICGGVWAAAARRLQPAHGGGLLVCDALPGQLVGGVCVAGSGLLHQVPSE